MANVIRKRKKGRKTVVIDESSSSNEETTPKDNESTPDCQHVLQNTSRSSERLQKKRCREFHMPSRNNVWEKITPSKSPGRYEQLRPRQIVNNFTKENNRYNYDPNETSGDESMEDFLDDSVSDTSSSDKELQKRSKPKRHRIEGRHQRLFFRSGSEDSDSTDGEVCGKETSIEKHDDILSGDSAICVKTCKFETRKRWKKQDQSEDSNGEKVEVKAESNDKGTGSDTGEETDEDDEVLVKTQKHNRSVIESDDNDSNYEDVEVKKEHNESIVGNDGSEEDVVVKRKLSRSVLESDDNNELEEIQVKQEENKSVFENDDNNGSKEEIVLKKEHSKSILESDTNGSVEVIVKKELSTKVIEKDNSNNDEEVVVKREQNTDNKEIEDMSSCRKSLKQEKGGNNLENFVAEVKCEFVVKSDLPENFKGTSNSREGIDIDESIQNETIDISDSESGSHTSDTEETGDSSEAEGCSSRVRVQMLKKKQRRSELFEKFRKERERRLSKEHK